MFYIIGLVAIVVLILPVLSIVVKVIKSKINLEFYRKQGATVYFDPALGFIALSSKDHSANKKISNTEALYQLAKEGHDTGFIATNMPIQSTCGVVIYTPEHVKEFYQKEDNFTKVSIMDEITESLGFFFRNGEEAIRLKSIFTKMFAYAEMEFLYSAIGRLVDGYIKKYNKEHLINSSNFKEVNLTGFFKPLMASVANYVIMGEESTEVPDNIKKLNSLFDELFETGNAALKHPLYGLLPSITKYFKLLPLFKHYDRIKREQEEIIGDIIKQRSQKPELGD